MIYGEISFLIFFDYQSARQAWKTRCHWITGAHRL
jgi:hypothetical protein